MLYGLWYVPSTGHDWICHSTVSVIVFPVLIFDNGWQGFIIFQAVLMTVVGNLQCRME